MLRKTPISIRLFLVVFYSTFCCCESQTILRRSAWLRDPDYLVSWEADFSSNVTTFTVEVRTKGFVGFGLSYNGGMEDADIFIGGVQDSGETYFGVKNC
jgi:hypothetical protein